MTKFIKKCNFQIDFSIDFQIDFSIGFWNWIWCCKITISDWFFDWFYKALPDWFCDWFLALINLRLKKPISIEFFQSRSLWEFTTRGWSKPDRCIAGAGWKWNTWKTVETQLHNYNYWKQPVAQFFCIQGRLIVGWATSEGSNFLAKLDISWNRQTTRATHPIVSTVLTETAVKSKCLHPRKRVFWLPPAIAFHLHRSQVRQALWSDVIWWMFFD